MFFNVRHLSLSLLVVLGLVIAVFRTSADDDPTETDFTPYGIYENTAPRAPDAEPVVTTLPLELRAGDRIALIGNTLFDRSVTAVATQVATSDVQLVRLQAAVVRPSEHRRTDRRAALGDAVEVHVELVHVPAHPHATATNADADCVDAVQAAASLCEELGHDVEEASPTVDRDGLFKAFGGVLTGYLGLVIKEWARRTGRNPEEEHFEPVTWRMYQHSQRQSGADYLLAWQEVHRCCRDFAAFFSDRSIWLTPTLVKPPVPLGYFDYSPEKRLRHIEHLGHFTGFTLIANASGHPAISLPLHWNGANLPIGVQLTGRYGDEATLIRLAAQLEKARPWSHRRPPVGAGNPDDSLD